jgi:galactokinase
MGSLGGAREHEAGLVEDLRQRFHATFGDGGGVRFFFCPGRVNLMGAHLDYNGGPVMPVALDRGTYLALRRRDDDRVLLAATLSGGTIEVGLAELPAVATGSWADYPLGVLRHLVHHGRALDARGNAGGLEVLYGGNLPIGAGLSSSASITVGTAFALLTAWQRPVDPLVAIRAALSGEREFVGVKCGIMDPYAVALARRGNLLWLDCRDASYEHLPLDPSAFEIAVVDSGVSRALARGHFNERVAQCSEAFERLRPAAPEARCLRDVPAEVVEAEAAALGPLLLKRARHVVSEVARTFAARDALLAGDASAFGALVSATHESLRDQYEVSTPELDAIVELARAWPGVLGARLTGAGFGGCAVVIARPGTGVGLADALARGFQARFGRMPAVYSFQSGGGPRELAA